MSNCDSESTIYIIKCDICNCFYIGETGRKASIRLKGNIKNFVPYEKRLTPVSIHFNLNNHSLNNFNLYLIKTDLDDSTRFYLEKKLIHKFKIYDIPILNIGFPSLYNINSKRI